MPGRLNFKITFILTLFFLTTIAENSGGQGKTSATSYYLKIRLDPSLNLIAGTAEISNPSDSIFLISNCLKINRVKADGIDAQFYQKPSRTSKNSVEISIRANSPGTIIFEYRGQILPDSLPGTISTLNMIRAGLVELTDFIDWYPRPKNHSQFTFKLDIDIPAIYTTVVNGSPGRQKKNGSRSQVKWESNIPVNRVELFAAPDIRVTSVEKDGFKVEVYYSKLPVSYVDSMKTNLLKSVELLTDIYGSTGSSSLIRLIYSPRSAGAYARVPLIFVSENYALEQRSHRYGMARDFRLNTHEIAHYWSRAKSDSREDWINEGLAEFSALWVSKEIIGEDFYNLLVNEYLDIIDNTNAESSIIETTNLSGDREVNRYYRPAIMLNDLRLKYGDQKMRQFITSLYFHFKQADSATSNLFLDAIEETYGIEERSSFSSALYAKSRGTKKINKEFFYAPSDTIFIGKWIGPLTQAGATTRFVMNLKAKEGMIIPTLDSPDQNATDIPVTDFKISGDSISYKIGVASAYFRGVINSSRNSIIGVFTQRTDNYHLNLYKQDEQ